MDYSTPQLIVFRQFGADNASRHPFSLPCRLITLPGIKVALIADASTDADHLSVSFTTSLTLAAISRYWGGHPTGPTSPVPSPPAASSPAASPPAPSRHGLSPTALAVTPRSFAPHSTEHRTSLHGASHLNPRSIAPHSTELRTSLYGASHLTPRSIEPQQSR